MLTFAGALRLKLYAAMLPLLNSYYCINGPVPVSH